MRTDPIGTLSHVLFGKTRRAILGLFYTRPDEWIHLRQAARMSGASVAAVQQELSQLASAGILERSARGNQVAFRINSACPIHAELASLVIKTVGMGDALRTALAPLADRVRVAFIYGSFARGEQRESSDVDVLIVGDVSLAECVPAFHAAQETLAREVNPSIYPPAEFAEKLRSAHHFLTSVVGGAKIFLIGDDNELKRLAQQQLVEAPHAKRGRNQTTRRGGRKRLIGLQGERALATTGDLASRITPGCKWLMPHLRLLDTKLPRENHTIFE